MKVTLPTLSSWPLTFSHWAAELQKTLVKFLSPEDVDFLAVPFTLRTATGTVVLNENSNVFCYRLGKLCHINLNINATLAGGPSASVSIQLPTPPALASLKQEISVRIDNAGVSEIGIGGLDSGSDSLVVQRVGGANFANGQFRVRQNFFYMTE